MDNGLKPGHPYTLKKGEGWIYRYGVDIVVKAGELQGLANATVMTYKTKAGEEAEAHAHATEDEMFYILKGSIKFRCGEETFKVKKGGFIFLPHGIPHSYKVSGKKPARVLVVTAPVKEVGKDGWGGFVAGMESGEAELIDKPSFEGKG